MKMILLALLGLMSSLAHAHKADCSAIIREQTFFAQLNHPSEALHYARLNSERPYLSSIEELSWTADRNFLISVAQAFHLPFGLAFREPAWVELAGKYYEVTPGTGLTIRRIEDDKVILAWPTFGRIPRARAQRPVFTRLDFDLMSSIHIYDSELAFAVFRIYLNSILDESEKEILNAEYLTRAEFKRWLSQHVEAVNESVR